MQRDFVTVDVFTDRRFGGSPLAVLPDGRGLTSAQMQAIAAEFNLSETTFVLPAKAPSHTAEVRIFTPKAELPFAGHPNVGTAFVLANRGVAGDALIFEEKAGLVRMKARPRTDVFAQHLPIDGAFGIHLYVRDTSEGIDIRARMFAPSQGMIEDPATGSANVALVGLLASLRPESDLALRLRIAQGVEMGRPSLIEAAAEKRGGRVEETRISGRCVAVMTGTIEI